MKKLLTLLFAVLLAATACFGLVACGSDDNKDPETPNTPADVNALTEAQFKAIFAVKSTIAGSLFAENVDYKANSTQTNTYKAQEQGQEDYVNKRYNAITKDGYKFKNEALQMEDNVLQPVDAQYFVLTKTAGGNFTVAVYDASGKANTYVDPTAEYASPILMVNTFNFSFVERAIDGLFGEMLLQTDLSFALSDFNYNAETGVYSLKADKAVNYQGQEYCKITKCEVKFVDGKISTINIEQTETATGDKAVTVVTMAYETNKETMTMETTSTSTNNGETNESKMKEVVSVETDNAGRTVKSEDKRYRWEIKNAADNGDETAANVEYEYSLNGTQQVNVEYASDGKVSKLTATSVYGRSETVTETVFTYAEQTVEIPEPASAGLEYELNAAGTAYSVKSMGTCTDSEIIIPSKYEGKPVESIAANAFYGKTDITSVILPSSLKTIGVSAFSGCTGLYTVTIPENVNDIGNYAFSGCTNLLEVINKSALIMRAGGDTNGSVDKYAVTVHKGESKFEDVDGCLFIKGDDGTNYLVTYVDKELVPHSVLNLPESYKGESYQIRANAFYGCRGVVSVVIPAKVTKIDTGAFTGCRIAEVVNKSSLTITKGATTNGSVAYKAVTVHSGELKYNEVEEFGFVKGDDNVNYLVKYLDSQGQETINLPASYQNGTYAIGESAFDSYRNLVEIYIPDNVTAIGKSAFLNCTSLRTVHINDTSNLTKIGETAFSGCSLLTGLIIPAKVTAIGASAFYDCQSLNSVDFKSYSGWKRVVLFPAQELDAGFTSDAAVNANIIKDYDAASWKKN